MIRTQQGQALIEGVAALLIMLALWSAIPWLARLQDIALQASHASRYAAFSFTRSADALAGGFLRQHYFKGASHRWSDQRGGLLLGDPTDNVSLTIMRDSTLPAYAQPGGAGADAQQLRRGWEVEDAGVASMHVAATPRFPDRTPLVVIQRHTAILAGAGHAAGDTDTQRRVAGSDLGWGNAAQVSVAAGRHIERRMRPVDEAWGRPDPDFDWLEPWSGNVPAQHRVNLRGGGHVH